MFRFNLFISILSIYVFTQAVSSYPALNDNKSLSAKASHSLSSQTDENAHSQPTNSGNPFATIISRLNEKIKAADSELKPSDLNKRNDGKLNKKRFVFLLFLLFM